MGTTISGLGRFSHYIFSPFSILNTTYIKELIIKVKKTAPIFVWKQLPGQNTWWVKELLLFRVWGERERHLTVNSCYFILPATSKGSSSTSSGLIFVSKNLPTIKFVECTILLSIQFVGQQTFLAEKTLFVGISLLSKNLSLTNLAKQNFWWKHW